MLNTLNTYCIVKNSLKFRKFKQKCLFYTKNIIFVKFLKAYNLLSDFNVLNRTIKTALVFFINLESHFNVDIKISFYKKNFKVKKSTFTKFNLFLKQRSLISNQNGLFISKNIPMTSFFGFIRFVVYMLRISRIFLDS